MGVGYPRRPRLVALGHAKWRCHFPFTRIQGNQVEYFKCAAGDDVANPPIEPLFICTRCLKKKDEFLPKGSVQGDFVSMEADKSRAVGIQKAMSSDEIPDNSYPIEVSNIGAVEYAIVEEYDLFPWMTIVSKTGVTPVQLGLKPVRKRALNGEIMTLYSLIPEDKPAAKLHVVTKVGSAMAHHQLPPGLASKFTGHAELLFAHTTQSRFEDGPARTLHSRRSGIMILKEMVGKGSEILQAIANKKSMKHKVHSVNRALRDTAGLLDDGNPSAEHSEAGQDSDADNENPGAEDEHAASSKFLTP